jgi:hypothetical protein
MYMAKLKIAQIIAGFSVMIGCMVMIGWYLDITVLTSIMPQWIRMKFATAICFVFSGIIVYALTFKKEERKEIRQIMLMVLPTLLVLVMGTLFLGSIFGFQTGVENIAFIDVHEINTPIFQGRPSVATMAAFLLIATIGFLYNSNKATKKTFSVIGAIVGVIGSVGVIGYLIGLPALYYEIPTFSNAIAIHTTILFALLGFAIGLIGQQQEEKTHKDEK